MVTENKYGYDLLNTIKNTKKTLKNEQLKSTYINQLVLKTKYQNELVESEEISEELLTILYISCAIESKIKKALKSAYKPYCSEEDFLSIFYIELQKCIKNYDINQGNFQNYLSKAVDVAFKNEKKSAFLKITGNIESTKRKEMYSSNIENYEISRKSQDQENVEKKIMNQDLYKKILSFKDGDIILYKYTHGDKPLSNEKVGEHFGLSERQVRTRIDRLSRAFKNENYDFFYDYFYDTDNVDTTICLQMAMA